MFAVDAMCDHWSEWDGMAVAQARGDDGAPAR
jgi:hypothetical protein